MNVAAILKDKGRTVFTAKAATPLRELAQALAGKKVGAVVIIDDDEQVIGIVSERDIVGTVAKSGPDAMTLPAEKIMTREVVTCTESDTIDALMSRMTALRFRHLPVVNDDGLAGIISIGDVVKIHIAAVEMEASALRSYIATG